MPVEGRGLALDDLIHADFARSLAYLADQSGERFPDIVPRLRRIAGRVTAEERAKPMAFRIYFRLVQALLTDNDEEVERLVGNLEAQSGRSQEMTFTHFGDPEADQLCLDLIEEGLRLAPISHQEAEAFTALLKEGLGLMKAALPDLYCDVTSIVREVLLARAPKGDKMEFDGASHYQFWGLLLLNPKHHKTPLAVVEVLAHEASHSLLFGLTQNEPLVLNPDDELFESPLRLDPRPMDGIYHAAYVSARMWWAMDQISRSEFLSNEERAWAKNAAEQDRENWQKGLSVINAHARLSDTGARVLNSAREAMDA